MLYYDEVFYSIQGESTDAGKPCVFVRLWGCPLHCNYCDQPQSIDGRKRITIEGIINLIENISKNCMNVCLTGGEPLIQNDTEDLVNELVSLGYKVSIETSGCVPIFQSAQIRDFKYIMDIKCPSSGVSSKNIFDNLKYLLSKDEVKFVISNREDYEYAKSVIGMYPSQAIKLFSPMFDPSGNITIGKELVEWLKEDEIPNSRVQIQMHKILDVR